MRTIAKFVIQIINYFEGLHILGSSEKGQAHFALVWLSESNLAKSDAAAGGEQVLHEDRLHGLSGHLQGEGG